VGATVLAEKIAGAAAERGGDLATVASLARRVNEKARSYGVALSSCIPPAAGSPIFDLPDGEMEVGIGIHGEPGRRREKLAPVDDMAEWLVSPIMSDLGLSRGDSVLAFVNGMGGTPLIELYIAFDSVARILAGQGITIGRSLVGNYITSLEMAGFSVTLLRLDDEFTRLWDAPVHTPALRWGV
jgi:dihydroxyacetone kinase-like protein